MRIIKADDYYSMSRMAANIISAQIIMKPKCVIGLATGSTPLGTYAQLIEWYKKGDLDFSEVTTINLDEYKGLSPENDQSYRYFMNKNLFDHINIKKENTYVPKEGEEDDIKARNDKIYEKFLSGKSIKELAREYSMTTKWIRNILKSYEQSRNEENDDNINRN